MICAEKFILNNSILDCENFDPNTQKYKVYAQDVDKIELSGLLMELSKMYFEQFGNEVVDSDDVDKNKVVPVKKLVYQCSDCLTVYDNSLGDSIADVSELTSFEDLTSDYECGVCSASKDSFVSIEL